MNQQTKVFIGTVVIIVAVIGLMWAAKPDFQGRGGASVNSGVQYGPNGVLSAEETSFDFGEISMRKGKVSYDFRIKNTGTDPLGITKMYTSCMCTTALLENNGREIGPFGMQGHGVIPKISEALRPGDEAIVRVIFDPAAHGPAGVGRIERTVYLENTSGIPFELGIRATVTP